MSVRFHYSLEHANRVLKLVRKRLVGFKGEVVIDAWANGREQGYHLSRSFKDKPPELDVVFAQQRTSDSVVVLWGAPGEFDITTNMPNENVWANRNKTIYPDEDAASFIADLILYYPLKEIAEQESKGVRR